MNINGYVPILINTLGAIVNMLSSSPQAVGYLFHAAYGYYIL